MESILLFSGGIDSTLIASANKPDILLFVDYGQVSASGELKAGRSISHAIDIPFEKLDVPIGKLGKGRLAGQKSSSSFWPFRNQFLLTVAAMRFPFAKEIWIGASPDDIYADCTSDFVSAFSDLMALQESSVRIQAPLLSSDIGQLVNRLPDKNILNLTISCHARQGPCGACAGCEKNSDFLARYLRKG